MSLSKNLTILQINDTHAYLEPHPELFWEGNGFQYRLTGGFARLSGLVEAARRENPGGVLLLDNGDTLHGTYPAVKTQGQALIPVLNHLSPAAMTAHWEFAYGPQAFKQRSTELNYPVLALNVRTKDTGELFFPGTRVTETAGLRIGIIGLASNIVDKVMPPSFSEGLQFNLGKEELPEAIRKLRMDERVNLVILLSHLGFPQDMQLAAETPGIDVLLSGHTHNRLYQPARVENTIVIQSGSHGSFLGRLDLEVSGGKITDFHHRLIEVSSDLPADRTAEALVKAAVDPFRDELSEVVGETTGPLDRGRSLESTLDNLLLAAIRENAGAQLAFSNGWRYGAPILPGKITVNDLYNTIPMNPPVSIVELTGSEVWEMLEDHMEAVFSRNPYRQMGGYVKRALGLKAYIKIENPPGQRLQKLVVGDEQIRMDQHYTAAFVTQQGVPARYGQQRRDTPVRAVEALRQYLGKHRPYQPALHETFVVV